MPSNPLRHRIEHAELLAPALIGRNWPGSALSSASSPRSRRRWGGPDRMYSRRLGERWRRTNPFRCLLDSGVALAGGSDAPITPIDPVAGIRAAINHPNPDQRVTGLEALAMFTYDCRILARHREGTGQYRAGQAGRLHRADCGPALGRRLRGRGHLPLRQVHLQERETLRPPATGGLI